MLRRIRQGYPLQLEQEELERLQRLPEYAMAEHVTDMLREHSEIAPDAAEIGFLAMYFANSDTMPKQNLGVSATRELHRLYLAQRIIGAAQRELQLHFEADEQLLEGLYSHLQATCSRLRLGSPIENPLTQEMIELYPTLYAAADNACAVLKEILEIDSVPPGRMCVYCDAFGRGHGADAGEIAKYLRRGRVSGRHERRQPLGGRNYAPISSDCCAPYRQRGRH